MSDLRLGINLWSQAVGWPEVLATARLVERLGYDSLWTWDHLHAIQGDPDQPILEGWTMLAALAASTSRVRLGAMVGANTFRNPGIVAKMTVTIDHVSGGRAILGIGGAWFEHEHTAHGIDFGSGFGQRLDRMDESVAAMKTLLAGGTVTSEPGAHYAFRELRHSPLPYRGAGTIPIMIGGNGRTKTLRTIARYGDMWNAFGTPDEVRELDGVLRDHCAAVGRDEREIERTINLWMVVRDDEADARRVWEALAAANRCPVAAITEPGRPLLGSPRAIADAILEYVDAGFATAIVELPAPYDVETIERLIGEVKPLVDAG
jgi:alkanesulfonate monooxygenase SsuD/methylene tetrahydromethanopterin reductase-like flavin-dependent oxidoreductase (luciferase family)